MSFSTDYDTVDTLFLGSLDLAEVKHRFVIAVNKWSLDAICLALTRNFSLRDYIRKSDRNHALATSFLNHADNHGLLILFDQQETEIQVLRFSPVSRCPLLAIT